METLTRHTVTERESIMEEYNGTKYRALQNTSHELFLGRSRMEIETVRLDR